MNAKPIRNLKKGPESIIQDAIIKKLTLLGWVVKSTHGNAFQWGFPDLYAAHKTYGVRWIEVKDPTRRGCVFTPAQLEFFHQLASVGVGVWVLTSDHDGEIKKLHGPANWYFYLEIMRS